MVYGRSIAYSTDINCSIILVNCSELRAVFSSTSSAMAISLLVLLYALCGLRSRSFFLYEIVVTPLETLVL